MVRRCGLVLWWIFLAVAVVARDRIVERSVDAIPLWQLIVVALILAGAAIPCMFWREICQWRRFGIMIPLVDATDAVWAEMGKAPNRPAWTGMVRFRNLTHMMFSGHPDALPLYGKRRPSRLMERIEDSHLFEFDEDGSATNPLTNPVAGDCVTELHVRKADLMRWIKEHAPRLAPPR